MTAGPEPREHPRTGAGKSGQRSLPKRFYKQAAAVPGVAGFQLALDGRPARTPGRKPLSVPARLLAEGIATEWAAQGDVIDPATMPLTKLANSTIDGVHGRETEVIESIRAYAASDLICYRAEGPAELVHHQAQAWDPVLAWARDALAARFVLGQGVMPVEQPAGALARIEEALGRMSAFELAAVHVMTTLTGSALLALAHASGRLSADDAWEAANIDETWQAGRWGEDAEAAKRLNARRSEFEAAARFHALLKTSE